MTIYRRRAGISETSVDDEIFLVPDGTEDILHLNPLGAAVWRLLADPIEDREVFEILAVAFPDISHVQLTQDAAAFLERLIARHLIEASES